MAHGALNSDSQWVTLGANKTDTEGEYFSDFIGISRRDTSDPSRTGISHTIDITLHGFYKMSDNVTVNDQIDIISIFNFKHNGTTAFDIQNALSVVVEW